MAKEKKQAAPAEAPKRTRRRPKHTHNSVEQALARFQGTVAEERFERARREALQATAVREDPTKVMPGDQYRQYLAGTRKTAMSPAKLARLLMPNARW